MPTADQRNHFARRAVEARALAEAATDSDIRTTLERMAESYDTLVEQADRIEQMRARIGQPEASGEATRE